MPDQRTRWIELLGRAQTGDAEAVLATIGSPPSTWPTERWLGDGSPEVQFVRVIALHCLAEYEAARSAAQTLIQTAEAIGDAAWLCVGRSYRVLEGTLCPESTAETLKSDTLLRELAEAESAIPEQGEPWTRSLAHIGVGRCYLHLRLYELALPHFQLAVELAKTDLPALAATAAAANMNLSDLNMRWGLELQRVGAAAASETHLAVALQHAVTAREMDSGPEDNVFHATANLFAACLASGDGDPHVAVVAITEALDRAGARGPRSSRALALLFIARACYRAGEIESALQAAHMACSALPPEAAEPLEAAVHYARADLLCRADPTERSAILEYGDRLALTMWRQRERTVALSRWMQGMQRIRREADGFRAMAFSDALTGVGNRHALARLLRSLMATQVEDVAVLIVDVDDLKAVNDLRGHWAGDSVLQTLAGVLTSHARVDDLVVRMGGDEFAVVATNMTLENAAMLAHRVVEAAAAALIGVTTVSVGVSIGSAASVEKVLLRTADEAMYAAKRSGGSAVRLSPPDAVALPLA